LRLRLVFVRGRSAGCTLQLLLLLPPSPEQQRPAAVFSRRMRSDAVVYHFSLLYAIAALSCCTKQS